MSDTSTSETPTLSSGTYDVLKPVALIILPALAALYSGLAGFWDFPKPVEVVGSITVLDTFLGALLHISSAQYNSSDSSAHAGTLAITGYNDVTGHPNIALTLDPTKVVDSTNGVAPQVTLKVDDQSGMTPPPLNTTDPDPAPESTPPATPPSTP